VRGLRAVASVHAVLVLAQAAFASRFLAGDAAGLRLNEHNAELIVTVALVQLVAAVSPGVPGGPAADQGGPAAG
jgi:hypothetical protein